MLFYRPFRMISSWGDGWLTAQKMKFPIEHFVSKCNQICSFLWIWSRLLKKSWMENFSFCAVTYVGSLMILSVKHKIEYRIQKYKDAFVELAKSLQQKTSPHTLEGSLLTLNIYVVGHILTDFHRFTHVKSWCLLCIVCSSLMDSGEL